LLTFRARNFDKTYWDCKHIIMRLLLSWPFVALLFLTQAHMGWAANKTLFEAYYKILANGQHVGYYIQRYELDPQKKEFISTYFLRTNQQGGNISESLKAHASESLAPIKYQYTSLQGKEAKTIDANIRTNSKGKKVLQVKTNENGKLIVSEKNMEEGTFFSTFLIYLLLQGKKGISPGTKYQFNAVAEEDGKVFPGEVFIQSEEQKMGLNTYKTLYTFKKTQFVNFINQAGESIISISPALGIEAHLVADPQLATKGMTVNDKSLALLFGSVPKGQVNQVVQSKNSTPKEGQ
jgi:hypothetical protein